MRQEDLIRDHEEALRLRVGGLSDEQKQAYFRALRHTLKDPDTYAVLNWFFVAGLHHFYLERWARGGALLVGWLVSVAMIFLAPTIIPGIVLILIIFAIELPALFRAQQIVRLHNLNLREQVLRDITGVAGPDIRITERTIIN